MRAHRLAAVAIAATSAACPIARPAAPSPGNRDGAAAAPLRLTATHLGPITPTTPITVAEIQRRLPGLTVDDQRFEAEEGTRTVLSVSRGSALLFEIVHEGDKLFSLQVHSPDIASDAGLVVGQSFAAAQAALGPSMRCVGMIEEEDGNALCRGAAGPVLAIVPMREPVPDFYGEEIPPARYAEVFAGEAKVQRVVWMP
jgi:hypothetical protein